MHIKDMRILLDDSVMQRGEETTIGSRILRGFVPPFGAEVADRLEKAGAVIAGKTNVDEFLIGDTICDTVEAVKSGRAAAAVACDVTGVIASQASRAGLFFLRPTYGSVSRFGLISTAASMEQLGVVCADPGEGAAVLSAIAGHDAKDGTSSPGERYDYSCEGGVKGMNFCLPQGEPGLEALEERLLSLGARVDRVNFDTLEYAPHAAFIIFCAELSNNITRFDGIKFGYRTQNFRRLDDIYVNSRTEALGIFAKLAALYGAQVLSKGRFDSRYMKAMKARRLIKHETEDLLSRYDCIALPVGAPPIEGEGAFGSVKRLLGNIRCGALPGLTGLPSAAMPLGVLVSGAHQENALLRVCKSAADV